VKNDCMKCAIPDVNTCPIMLGSYNALGVGIQENCEMRKIIDQLLYERFKNIKPDRIPKDVKENHENNK